MAVYVAFVASMSWHLLCWHPEGVMSPCGCEVSLGERYNSSALLVVRVRWLSSRTPWACPITNCLVGDCAYALFWDAVPQIW